VRSYHGSKCDSDQSRSDLDIALPVEGLTKPKINVQIFNDPIKLKELQVMKEGGFASGDINVEDTVE
jgi:hypothetical protein